MKRILIAVVVLATMAVAMDSHAQAAQRRVYRPSRTVIVNRSQAPMGGFFQRLMELERAKNQWLFGR